MGYNFNTFERKGYGRIFVEKEEDIPKVREIIRKMDEFEYSYLPEDLITVFNPEHVTFESDSSDHIRITLAYTHKFDSLDLNEFQMRCWMEGIKVFCWIDGSGGNYPEYKYYDAWEES